MLLIKVFCLLGMLHPHAVCTDGSGPDYHDGKDSITKSSVRISKICLTASNSVASVQSRLRCHVYKLVNLKKK